MPDPTVADLANTLRSIHNECLKASRQLADLSDGLPPQQQPTVEAAAAEIRAAQNSVTAALAHLQRVPRTGDPHV
jgi:hypothetical protein